MNIVIAVYVGLVGLMLGSFVNALVYRVYISHFAPKNRRKPLSIAKGRSVCVHCGHVLSAKDLIPLLSWISLKGKCRYCHKPISAQYPLVELATALLAAVSFLLWPYSFDSFGIMAFIVWLGILTLAVAMSVFDLRWMLLPNQLVYPFTFLTVLWVALGARSHWSALIGPMLGGLLLGGLFYLIFQVSNGKWIGGGDVRLGFGLGLVSGGLLQATMLLFLASLLGLALILSLSLVTRVTRKTKVPFGPMLLVGMLLTVLLWPYMGPVVNSLLFISV